MLPGCLAPGYPLTASQRAAADAARPLLTLDSDAVWVDAYNRLIELGPAAMDYLLNQPAMTGPVAADDLAVLLHTSLSHLLIRPGAGPRLTASALETTLDVLHLDVKVDGHSLGTIFMPAPEPPASWLDLFPADFDRDRAARVDLGRDRAAMVEWWRANRARAEGLLVARALRPRTDDLWLLLNRRRADRWQYQPVPRAILCADQPGGVTLFRPILCSDPPGGATLLDLPAYDYNLLRATCIWLGSSAEDEGLRRLVDLAGSPLPVVAHNARFALRYCRDPRLRELIERYDPAGDL